jgi:hypothetical protein
MEHPDDYRRAMGVLPRDENMPLAERVRRFYELHCPDRIVESGQLAAFFEGLHSAEPLWEQLLSEFGVDPLDR